MKLINPPKPNWKNIERGLREIHKSNQLVTGDYTELVEEEIKQIHGCKYCVVLSSATTAFTLLLKAVEKYYTISDIMMQDFTWESTKDIVSWMYPMIFKEYCDIDKDTWLAEEPEYKLNRLFIPNMTFGNVKTYKHKQQFMIQHIA